MSSTLRSCGCKRLVFPTLSLWLGYVSWRPTDLAERIAGVAHLLVDANGSAC